MTSKSSPLRNNRQQVVTSNEVEMVEYTYAQLVKHNRSSDRFSSRYSGRLSSRLSNLLGRRTEDFEISRQIKREQKCCSKLGLLIKNIQNQIYLFVEDPSSSQIACIFQYIIISCIVISCFDIIISSFITDENDDYNLFSRYLNILLLGIFIVEYILRFISSTAFENKFSDFICSTSNIIDVFAIIPSIVILYYGNQYIAQLPVIRIIRLLRIFQIFKVSRYVKRLSLILLTIKQSCKEILILMSIYLFVGLIVACVVSFWEKSYQELYDVCENCIDSYPTGIWWSLTTMSTTGYGDAVPKTVIGKFIASFLALFGMSTLSLPISILSKNFSEALNKQKESNQIKKMKNNLLKISDDSRDQLHMDKYELDQQELDFMERRLHLICSNTQNLVELTNKQENLFFEITVLLKGLYVALSKDMDMHSELKIKYLNASSKVMKIQKSIHQKSKLRLSKVVNRYKKSQQEYQRKTNKSSIIVDNYLVEEERQSQISNESVIDEEVKSSIQSKVIIRDKYPLNDIKSEQNKLKDLSQKSWISNSFNLKRSKNFDIEDVLLNKSFDSLQTIQENDFQSKQFSEKFEDKFNIH